MVLVRLAENGMPELTELVTEAWLAQAPRTLVKAFLGRLSRRLIPNPGIPLGSPTLSQYGKRYSAGFCAPGRRTDSSAGAWGVARVVGVGAGCARSGIGGLAGADRRPAQHGRAWRASVRSVRRCRGRARIEEIDGPVVVVAHSYAGAVVSEAAAFPTSGTSSMWRAFNRCRRGTVGAGRRRSAMVGSRRQSPHPCRSAPRLCTPTCFRRRRPRDRPVETVEFGSVLPTVDGRCMADRPLDLRAVRERPSLPGWGAGVLRRPCEERPPIGLQPLATVGTHRTDRRGAN